RHAARQLRAAIARSTAVPDRSGGYQSAAEPGQVSADTAGADDGNRSHAHSGDALDAARRRGGLGDLRLRDLPRGHAVARFRQQTLSRRPGLRRVRPRGERTRRRASYPAAAHEREGRDIHGEADLDVAGHDHPDVEAGGPEMMLKRTLIAIAVLAFLAGGQPRADSPKAIPHLPTL